MAKEGEAAKTAKTKYHVLRQTAKRTKATESGGITPTRNDAFELVAENVEANGDQHAIRLYLEKAVGETSQAGLDHTSATYVAVPSRSWKPTPATIKVESRVLVG